MSLEIASQSSPTDEQNRKKLQQLEAELSTLRGSSAQLTTLGQGLFARAPRDFMDRTSTKTLAKITEETMGCVATLAEAKKPFQIAVANPLENDERSGLSTLTLAISDRPFVVDSVAEYLRIKGLTVHTLLHPIVRYQSQLIAVTYAEFDRLDDPQALQQINADLEAILQQVIVVTDDFLPMRACATEAATAVDTSLTQSVSGDTAANTPDEVANLLQFLADGGFMLAGLKIWQLDKQKIGATERELGLFRLSGSSIARELEQVENDVRALLSSNRLELISKLLIECVVHRRAYFDCFVVRIRDSKTGSTKVLALVGLLTSRALSREATSVPVLRHKLERLITEEGYVKDSHDFKQAITLTNNLPKSELMQGTVSHLRHTLHLLMGVERRSRARVQLYPLSLGRFAGATVAMPSDRYSSDAVAAITDVLATKFCVEPRLITSHVAMVENHLAAIFFIIPTPEGSKDFPDVKELEQIVAEAAMTWDDKLLDVLSAKLGKKKSAKLFELYTNSFPESYRAQFSPTDAEADIEVLESLTKEKPLDIAIRPTATVVDGTQLFDLRFYYRGTSFSLSTLIPILENVGFEVFKENSFALHNVTEAKITSIHARPRYAKSIDAKKFESVLIPGFREIFAQRADNDGLNSLLVNPGLVIREIQIVRTLAHYLWQIKGAPSENLIQAALIEYPAAARALVDYFTAKFDPSAFNNDRSLREKELQQVEERYLEILRGVTSLAHDRILHTMLKIIQAAVRTNFFRNTADLRTSIKINSKLVPNLPNPRPYFEIFVCAPQVEGIHLRGGKVARGGLRWSERPDDFRTEILGLMKTQMVKNTIIVPVGAKGGFIVRGKAGKVTPEDVVSCYRLFIRSLLEVTDNRVNGQVVHPENCVIYDEADPYFVVAADKGTASFSDVANEIAVTDFNLWIGDAFASGGSNGYSHKKYGITARGAWEAVLVHFRELGIDVETQGFTVAGIGDMSGDVFGNGLIISDKAKLLAAFDHRHIFLDPNPDATRSFQERCRMFELPRSSWMDYDKSLISKGGGVYPREEKAIKLTPEVKQALDIQEDVLSGHELIQRILKAPVDLLWNGGIGTYVKASSQEHIHAADRTNDDVRVDAKDLRAKIVGEGGNLGFTQLARIEYAQFGRLNTDAIDNSGGVDLSDHEVNLKILLSGPMSRGELSFEDRNKLLLSCVDEVCQSVLVRNRAQSAAVSITLDRSASRASFTSAFMRKLEKEGLLDRKGEALPDDETLFRRARDRIGLYRPEASVLIAYSKMLHFNQLLAGNLVDDPYLSDLLRSYFPKVVVQRFEKDVLAHPLRREIVATQIVNLMVERMGPLFVNRVASETGTDENQVIRAFLVAYEIAGVAKIVEQLQQAENSRTMQPILDAYIRLYSALYGMTRWLLRNWKADWTLAQVVERYGSRMKQLLSNIKACVPISEQGRFAETVISLKDSGMPRELAEIVAGLTYVATLLEITEISMTESVDVLQLAHLYGQLSADLRLAELLARAAKMETIDQWDTAARRAIILQLREVLGGITMAIIHNDKRISADTAKGFLEKNHDSVRRYLDDLREFDKRPLTISALLVLSQQLQTLGASSRR